MLRLVTWNIDGLDPAYREARMAAIGALLAAERPEVALLQEVVAAALPDLTAPLRGAGYALLAPPLRSAQYGCAMLVRRDALSVAQWEYTPFPESHMGRGLLSARVDWRGQELLLLTSHFESMAAAARERQRQLAAAVARLEAHRGPALFGGDTNLRDPEVGPLAARFADAWEQVGSPEDRRYTWDLLRNKNKKIPAPSPPRKRYDRVLLNLRPGWRATSLRLLGERSLFPGVWMSDHFGVEVAVALEEPGAGEEPGGG